MVKVLPEIAVLDGIDDVPVGRRDDADIHAQFLRAAHADKGTILEKAQQLGLQRAGHLSDLVEKQRAAVGLLHLPGLLLHGAGERSLFVPEQLALEQRLRDGRAVQPHVRLLPPLAGVVNRSRDQLLAGSALAENQDRGLGRANRPDHFAQLLQAVAVPDDVVQLVAEGQPRLELFILPDELVPLGAPVDGVQQLLRLERLGEVIDRAGLDRLHRQFRRGVGGDHQHRQVGPSLVSFTEEIVAAHPLEPRVGDDHEIA